MLSTEENIRLTQVSRGTPMGELMRRYWQPILLSSELPEPDGAPPIMASIVASHLASHVALFDLRQLSRAVSASCNCWIVFLLFIVP